jgi:pyruvate dehydrogenase E1 component alpha subunit
MVERETALDLLRTMWRIRCFEERVAKLHHSLQVHGLVHLSIGSEGVAAGVCRQLRDDDAVYSGHRAHGHALAKGAPMDRVMAELMGRSAGLCQGLGGSMHLVDTAHGLMGATGVVGGNLPMAAGDALAARLRGEDRVAVAFFGDGAVQAGRTMGAAAHLRLREQRHGRIHATLRPHQGRSRHRCGGAL